MKLCGVHDFLRSHFPHPDSVVAFLQIYPSKKATPASDARQQNSKQKPTIDIRPTADVTVAQSSLP